MRRDSDDGSKNDVTRRELLSRGLTTAGWGAFVLTLGTGAAETVRFFVPQVLFHPPSRFRIGTPEAFRAREGTADAYGVLLVDDHWKSTHRFFVVREQSRIYAVSARCAHLGCTVNWFPDQRAFRCPCHGSEYHANGQNFAGPAPHPLDRLAISLNLDGELVVDTAITYAPDRFQADGAYVQI